MLERRIRRFRSGGLVAEQAESLQAILPCVLFGDVRSPNRINASPEIANAALDRKHRE